VKIHFKANFAKLAPGRRGELSIPELEADGIHCAGPLHYDLQVGISSGALWANGSLRQPVELTCVSCLEKFVHNITVAGLRAAQGIAWPGGCRSYAFHPRRPPAQFAGASALRSG